MKGVTSLFLLQSMITIYSLSFDEVCDGDDIKCQHPQISNPGEVIYGQCYRQAALRRLLKVSFLTCLKECMKTSTCFNVSYRRAWRMCDINGNVHSEVELVHENWCFSSNISRWSKALAGECANHSCREGYKCVSERDGRRCELAYCSKRPSVANAELYEPFGLSRDLGRGMIYKCENGFKLRGKPFAVCRNTGIWKFMFTCEKPCEKGWIHSGGQNYCIGPDKKTWNDSTADCISKGSYLVKTDHAAENDWLEKVMIDNDINHMWIGAHDIGHEGSWRWVYDNTTVNYTNWLEGEPNYYEHAEGHENCAEMWDKASYRWNDKVCTSVIQYVCEKHILA